MSQNDLATQAEVSRRFVVQLERGEGNVTLLRLADVCAALSLRLDVLFEGIGPSTRDTIALVGLRGAGKTTVGRHAARRLGAKFVELDQVVQREAGMSLAEIFEFRGTRYYRQVEFEVMERVVNERGPKVIATGGSLPTSDLTWNRLRRSAHTIWLSASPQSHLERVRAQGDLRPMAGRDDALSELETILADREPFYAMAHERIDTDTLGLKGTVDAVVGQRAA